MGKRATPESFWNRVKTGHPNDCWPWTGAVNNSGYGTVSYRGKTRVAHRVAAYLSGLVPTAAAPRNRKGGGFVLHECDNARCCNPKHFKVGTYADNQKDAYRRTRRQAAKGWLHANAKLDKSAVLTIRDMLRNGVSQSAAGALFGVSQRAVSNISLGKTYAAV